MQYRPYQYERDKINLYNSLEAFNQKHHYQNKKVNNKKRPVKSNELSISQQEKESKIKGIKIIITTLIVLLCAAVCITFMAKINERVKEVDILVKNNQLLLSQNNHLEYTLLSDINGKPYQEYITEDLGMSKNNRIQQYIDVEKYKDERTKTNESQN